MEEVIMTVNVFGCCLLLASLAAAQPATGVSNITAVWANEGGDKVTQDELRATKGVENKTGTVRNRTWDGQKVRLFGARNEVISFNLVIEAGKSAAPNVSVAFDELVGPNGSRIASKPTNVAGAFQWTTRPIELFLARYVQIRGLSFFGYFKGDERQIPVRFQASSHQWKDRPDHDKFYPDALVPMEAFGKFDIAQSQNQSVWVDLYIPKNAAAGDYSGSLKISENGSVTKSVPVTLKVESFTLPDLPAAKTMVALDTPDIMHRYIAPGYVNWASEGGKRAEDITDVYYSVVHRHKISLVGENECVAPNRPCDRAVPRLNGSLFTAAHGYAGPGTGSPTTIYSIGTYGTWAQSWRNDPNVMHAALNEFGAWAQKNTPGTEYAVYLQDEPPAKDYPQIETWAKWMHETQGPGKSIKSLVTIPAVLAKPAIPDLDIVVQPSGTGNCPPGQSPCDNTKITQALHDYYTKTPGKQFWMYNDGHPSIGSAMTEDDGVAMRTFGWAQWKKGVDRWFYWFANINCGSHNGCADWYKDATTWGHRTRMDPSLGMWGDDAPSNGNGLLIYPGSDLMNPASSYKLVGPVASIRLKEWRRGIQDADYLALAHQLNAKATDAVVSKVMPKALWDLSNPDPTYYVGEMPYSSNPDDWEAARARLASIIATACSNSSASQACR